MGGGDLNLKKSWHPSTLKNVERVWKAEQKHETEQKKIEQLQRELQEERAREEMQQFAQKQGVVKKKKERLDWMYQGPAALVNREDYLLGKQVDKTFEVLNEMEKGNSVPNIDNEPGALFCQPSGSGTVDLARKIAEDPLFLIKKKEDDQKRLLLDNPIRMKQLRSLLKQATSKKSKKHKKKKHSSRSDSSDSENESERRAKKKRKHDRDRSRDRDSSEENPWRKKVKEDDRYSKHKQRYEPTSQYRNNDRKNRVPPAEVSRKKTPEELEKMRQEMMSNAKWRDEQRQIKVEKYRKEAEEEEKATKKGNKAGFIRPLLSKAAETGSVEGRIKQKIYNIQRSGDAMERNFARR